MPLLIPLLPALLGLFIGGGFYFADEIKIAILAGTAATFYYGFWFLWKRKPATLFDGKWQMEDIYGVPLFACLIGFVLSFSFLVWAGGHWFYNAYIA